MQTRNSNRAKSHPIPLKPTLKAKAKKKQTNQIPEKECKYVKSRKALKSREADIFWKENCNLLIIPSSVPGRGRFSELDSR